MADPFSLALTVAVNLASMAMTAMQKHEGPRLQDLSVTVADYGTPIPYLEGRRRIETPVMHAEPLKEKKTKNKTKGGKYTEYKYYGTWANLVCGNQTAVLCRIWGDRHLLFDKDHPYKIRKGLPKLKLGRDFRFYNGSEEQLPDERIAARIRKDEGSADLTPAYRGTTYVMFEDIPLEHFGNRLPQMSIEVSTVTDDGGSSDISTIDYETQPFPIIGQNHLNYSPSGLFAVAARGDISNLWFNSFALIRGAYDIQGNGFADISDGQLSTPGLQSYVAIDDLANVYIHDNDASLLGHPRRTYKTTAGGGGAGITTQIGSDDDIMVGAAQGLRLQRCVDLSTGSHLVYVDQYGVQNPIVQLRNLAVPSVIQTYFLTALAGFPFYQEGILQDGFGDLWVVGTRVSDWNADLLTGLVLYRVHDSGQNPIADLQQLEFLDNFTGSDIWYTSIWRWGDYYAVAWGGEFPDLYIVDNQFNLVEKIPYSSSFFSQGYQPYLWSYGINQFTDKDYEPNTGKVSLYWFDDLTNDCLQIAFMDWPSCQIAGTYDLTTLAKPVGEEDDIWPAWLTYDPTVHGYVMLATGNLSFEATQSITFLYIATTAPVTLGTICARVARQTGMEEADFDFDALDQPIYGYSWVQGTARDIVSALLEIHDSDIRPNGFIQEGIKRGGALNGPMITYDWMVREAGGQDGSGEPLYRVNAVSESDLPRRLQVVFSEIAREQQPNTAVAQRNGESVWTNREVPVDLTSLAISADDIQPLSERSLRRQWMGAVGIDCSLTARDMALLPGHVRNLGLEDGVVIRGKLVRQTIRPNRSMVLRWERDGAVPVAQTNWEDDEGSLISDLPDSPGAIPGGRPPPSIYDPVESVGWALDIPLLTDADERTAPFIYFAASPAEGLDEDGNEPDWSGATILASDTGDPETFEDAFEVVGSSDRAIWGTTGSVLGQALHTVIDEQSELVIEIVQGSLESVALEDLLADGTLNLALVGDELIQFRDGIIQSGGQYVCRGLLRGRRGTERHIGTHQLGERFILMDDMVGIHSMGASEIGDTDYYKFVTNGFDPADYDAEAIEFTAEAHRPLSPVHVTVTRDGNDYIIDGMRRTRIGGSSVNGQDVPLGEVSELYRIRVLDPDYEDGVALRETTTLPFTYTEAMLIADLGSVPDELTISICQMSPALSLEGHATEATGS